MGANTTIQNIANTYMQNIGQYWVNNSAPAFVINSSDVIPDSIFANWKDQSTGKVLVLLGIQTGASMDGEIITGIKIGALTYSLSKSVEIEGGYEYTSILPLYIDVLSEQDFTSTH